MAVGCATVATVVGVVMPLVAAVRSLARRQRRSCKLRRPLARAERQQDRWRPGDICEYSLSGDAARPVTPPPTTGVPTSGTISYVLPMTNGEVTITLDRAKAPCTVNSFVSLADQGYFDNTKCHRLADSGIFVLQCGDPTGTGNGGPGYEFANETDGTESYTEGVVAMANGGPGTNGSQFFLVWADSTSLDQTPNFTIFGKMNKASRDVVASMAGEGQDGSNADGTGRPNNPCEIATVTKVKSVAADFFRLPGNVVAE